MRRRKVLAIAGAALGLFAFTGIAMAAPSPPAPTPDVPLAGAGKYQTAKFIGITAGSAKFYPGCPRPNGDPCTTDDQRAKADFVSGFTKPSGKLFTKKAWKNAAMTFRTSTGNGVYPGTDIPNPAVRAQVVFSSNLKFNFAKAGPPCVETDIAGMNTELARAECPNSILGVGSARVRIPNLFNNSSPLGTETRVVITAFRGENDSNGNPTIILFSVNQATATGTALIGTVVNKPGWAGSSEYGKMLDVRIPLLTAGTTSLTQFEVTVGNGYKPGFIQAKCTRPTFKTSSRFYFSDKNQAGGTADDIADSYLPASGSTKCG